MFIHNMHCWFWDLKTEKSLVTKCMPRQSILCICIVVAVQYTQIVLLHGPRRVEKCIFENLYYIYYTFIEKHTLMYSTTRAHTSMHVQNSLSFCRRSFGKQKLVIPKQVTWKGWKFTYDNWSWRCHARRFQESKMVSGFHLLPCCDIYHYY